MPNPPLSLLEFPADDPERARRFWGELLGAEFQARTAAEGEGWQMRSPTSSERIDVICSGREHATQWRMKSLPGHSITS